MGGTGVGERQRPGARKSETSRKANRDREERGEGTFTGPRGREINKLLREKASEEGGEGMKVGKGRVSNFDRRTRSGLLPDPTILPVK